MNTNIPLPAISNAAEDKTVAIVAYITLFGFLAAIVVHSNRKTSIGAYHLRQALGLLLSGFALGVIACIPILGWLISVVGWIFLIVLWVFGLIAAINGQKKPVPLLGTLFEKWFGNAFD